jgi:hypothetical protein
MAYYLVKPKLTNLSIAAFSSGVTVITLAPGGKPPAPEPPPTPPAPPAPPAPPGPWSKACKKAS